MSQEHLARVVKDSENMPPEEIWPGQPLIPLAVAAIPAGYVFLPEHMYDPNDCPDWLGGTGVTYHDNKCGIAIYNGMNLAFWLLEFTA